MPISLVHKLADIVSEYPDNIAIVQGEKEISYRDLWLRIESLSAYLFENGLQQGDRVALIQNNSADYVISYYSILYAGSIVVPLNTAANYADIVNWLVHSQSSWIIYDKQFVDEYKLLVHCENNKKSMISVKECTEVYRDKIICLSSILDNNTKKLDICNIHNNMLASIIYTSGTTGAPKGVMLTHGNFISNFTSINNYLMLSNSDSILNVLPFYYSYGNSILHTHLITGAKLILENSFMFPVNILKMIETHKVTGFSGVPSTYAILLSRTKLENYDLSSLRYLTQAGGPMPKSNIQKIAKFIPNVNLFVMYGQTEATARLTYLPPEMLNKKLGSVGIPIDGVSIEIRDDRGNISPCGETGELYVKGDNIMTGYWQNQQLTDQVIINGYLKTGDIGNMDNEGYIYLTGRKSDMIKVGGNRISPVEIEEVISRLDAIEEVAARGVDDEILGEVIKVVIVLKKEAEIETKEIKAFCKENLALYKIPKYIEFKNELPKTSSGKIKRYLI